MLHLASATSASWGDYAVQNLDVILVDHAHCEKKAASTAINLIFKYPEHKGLLLPLSRLAREELAHFEAVVQYVRDRGGEYERQKPSSYASRLLTIARAQEPQRMLDVLLCCAMIEARSCERMQVFADALGRDGSHPDAERLYRSLLASEARHHASYVDLARASGIADPDAVRLRLSEVAAHEASVLESAPVEPRLHSGGP